MSEMCFGSHDYVVPSNIGGMYVVAPDVAVSCGPMVRGLTCQTHESSATGSSE